MQRLARTVPWARFPLTGRSISTVVKEVATTADIAAGRLDFYPQPVNDAPPLTGPGPAPRSERTLRWDRLTVTFVRNTIAHCT